MTDFSPLDSALYESTPEKIAASLRYLRKADAVMAALMPLSANTQAPPATDEALADTQRAIYQRGQRDGYELARREEAQREAEAVAWRCTGDEIRCFDGNGCECAMRGKAPPTADEALADTQRAIIEAAERRGYERGLREAPPAAVLEGYVAVPKRMTITAEMWEVAQGFFGGPGTGDGEPFLDCVLWVGETVDVDDGKETRTYGLNIACLECLEEGSVPLVEFAPAQKDAAQ